MIKLLWSSNVDLTKTTWQSRLNRRRGRSTTVDLSKATRRVNLGRCRSCCCCCTDGSWRGHETTPARTRRSRRFWCGYLTTPTRGRWQLLDVHGGRSSHKGRSATSYTISKIRCNIRVTIKQKIKGDGGSGRLSSEREAGLIENNMM
jgi:hypothetical protein